MNLSIAIGLLCCYYGPSRLVLAVFAALLKILCPSESVTSHKPLTLVFQPRFLESTQSIQ